MLFLFENKIHIGDSAIDILRRMMRDSKEYSGKGTNIREFLAWSLKRLDDRLPGRDLLLTDSLDDETLALSYLCLLDHYGLGALDTVPRTAKHGGS
jgi:negative regulator of replication initiation